MPLGVDKVATAVIKACVEAGKRHKPLQQPLRHVYLASDGRRRDGERGAAKIEELRTRLANHRFDGSKPKFGDGGGIRLLELDDCEGCLDYTLTPTLARQLRLILWEEDGPDLETLGPEGRASPHSPQLSC